MAFFPDVLWCYSGPGLAPGRWEQRSLPHVPLGQHIKATGKGRSKHRARNRRASRARASKDTSKLLLLYDEDILERDPLREQKDLAFAQAYLTRVGHLHGLSMGVKCLLGVIGPGIPPFLNYRGHSLAFSGLIVQTQRLGKVKATGLSGILV